jgi:insecticidal toxin complex protein TccC
MTHANTPAIQALDPRGLPVRSVACHRRDASSTVESYITQQIYDAAGRALQSRDPRLFLQHQLDRSAPANQRNVFSLSGSPLLSENTDAGWRLSLIAADGISLEGWDEKRNHRRTGLDSLRRPSAIFEQAANEPEHCTARFTYGDEPAEIARNRRGRLIRHDDTAGTLHFAQLSMSGLPLQCSRTFCADPEWPVNWPEVDTDRDHFLESNPATTLCTYNAVGELTRQIDALGNQQILLQDRAGQLREIRLTLAASVQSQTLASGIQSPRVIWSTNVQEMEWRLLQHSALKMVACSICSAGHPMASPCRICFTNMTRAVTSPASPITQRPLTFTATSAPKRPVAIATTVSRA